MAPKRPQYSLEPQLETPKKNRIIGAKQLADSLKIDCTQKQLGEIFEATPKQVSYAIKSETERTKKRSKLKALNHQKLTERDVDKVCQYIDENEELVKELDWESLLNQFGFEIHWKTFKGRLQERGYFIFKSVSFKWIDSELAEYRVRWCELMIKKYPNKEDWYHIRWSDETHFGWGPEGSKGVLRKRGRGNRYKPVNIQRLETQTDTKEEANQKRVHF